MANRPKTPEEAAWLAEITAKAVASGNVIAPSATQPTPSAAPIKPSQEVFPEPMQPKRPTMIGTPDPDAAAQKEAQWKATLAAARNRSKSEPEARSVPTRKETRALTPAATRSQNHRATRVYERAEIIAAIKKELVVKLATRDPQTGKFINQSDVYSCIDDFNVLINPALSDIPPAKSIDHSLKSAFGVEQMRKLRSRVLEPEGRNTDARKAIALLNESIDAVALAKWGTPREALRPQGNVDRGARR